MAFVDIPWPEIREFGIRLALGAQPRDVLMMVLNKAP